MKTIKTRAQYFQLFRNKILDRDLFRLEFAYDLTKYSHGYLDQVRDGGERYFNHPRTVSIILATELDIFDADVHIGALMHDCPEDTHLMSYDRILFVFGKQIAHDVLAVTKMNTKNMMKSEYLKSYFEIIKKTGWRASVIKCVDRIHNLRSLPDQTDKDIAKIKKQIFETNEYFPTLYPVIAKHNEQLSIQIQGLINKELKKLERKVVTK